MFKNKKQIMAILMLAFGIVLSVTGFICGIVVLFKYNVIAGGSILIFVCGIGLTLAMIGFSSDDLP